MASVPTVERIANGYAALTRSDAGSRWRWAHQILALRSTQTDAKKRDAIDREIGAKCAEVIGRKKPYSAPWVRAYVNAAQKFPNEPKDPLDCERFLALCNNSQSKSASTASKTPGTKDDALRMLASAVKLALKRGATADEIASAVEALLTTPDEAAPATERQAA